MTEPTRTDPVIAYVCRSINSSPYITFHGVLAQAFPMRWTTGFVFRDLTDRFADGSFIRTSEIVGVDNWNNWDYVTTREGHNYLLATFENEQARAALRQLEASIAGNAAYYADLGVLPGVSAEIDKRPCKN